MADVAIDMPRPRDLDVPFANAGFESYHQYLHNHLRLEVQGTEAAGTDE